MQPLLLSASMVSCLGSLNPFSKIMCKLNICIHSKPETTYKFHKRKAVRPYFNPSVACLKAWNTLLDEIQGSHLFGTFKTQLKKCLTLKYKMDI